MPSIMQRIGTPNARHNLDNKYRKQLDNVDPELSRYNQVISHRSVEEIYQEFLQPSFDAFNERQKRKDRRLDVKYGCSSYIEYQRALDAKAKASSNAIDKKGRPPIREIIWQIGNPEQGYGSKDQSPEQREWIKGLLLECQAEAERRYPQFVWGDKIFHADEVSTDADGREHGTDHLHSSFVPLCFNNKQGPDVQVAFERCLHEMGFESFNAWKHDLDQLMEEVLHRHGLERTFMDNHEKHQDSTEWHRQQAEIQRTKALQQQRIDAELQLEAAKLNGAEKLNEFLAAETERIPENSSALFFLANCSDEEYAELAEKGRALMRSDKDLKDFSRSPGALDDLIAAAGKRPTKLRWDEKNQLWDQYSREVSEPFWEMQKVLKLVYNAEISNAYEGRRSALWQLHHCMYVAERSRSLITLLIKTVQALVAARKVDKFNRDIKELCELRKDLAENTASFARFSRAYRDDLKAGKLPARHLMDKMEGIVQELDMERNQFRELYNIHEYGLAHGMKRADLLFKTEQEERWY